MTPGKRDTTPWLLTGCIALTLSGVSALAPRARVLAQSPQVKLAGVMTTPTPAAGDDKPMTLEADDDGDELLEHWDDHRYSREQRVQLAGLALFFGAAGTLARRRRTTRLRKYRHG